MEEKSKRRNYFIDKTFQTKFMIKFCIIVIISSALIIGLVVFLSKGSTTVAIENTEVVVKSTTDFILPIVIQTVLFTFLFSATAVLLLTMLVSHKVAGPLFRLKNEIDVLKRLDLSKNVDIRGNDQLQNFAKSLNEMRISLQEKHLHLKESYKKLKDYLERKDYLLSPEDKVELIKTLQALEQGLNEFKT